MPPGQRPTVDPQLEDQGRRLALPAPWFGLIALVLAVPGVVLLIVTSGWAWALGIVLVALAIIPAVVASGLLGTSTVARWAARRRPFA